MKVHYGCTSPALQAVPPGNWYCIDCIRETSEVDLCRSLLSGTRVVFRQSPCIVENVRCEYGKVLIDLSEAPIPNSNSGGGGDPGLLLPPSKSNVPSPSRRATTVAFKELLCSVTDVERRDLLRGFGADAEDWSIAVADKNLYVLMTCPGHRSTRTKSKKPE